MTDMIRARLGLSIAWGLAAAGILLCVGTFCHAAPPITDGLVAWYPLDNDYQDGWGSNDATSYGTSFTADRYGHADSACLFDTFQERIGVPHGVLNGREDFSLFMRVNVTDINVIAAFVSAANATHDNEALLQYCPSSQLGLGSAVHDQTGWSGLTFPLEEWVSLAWVRHSGTGTSDLYVMTEGATGAVPATTTDLSGAVSVDAGGLWLGQDQDAVGGGWQQEDQFYGIMDDVYIYGRALSSDEVWLLHIPEPAMLVFLALGGLALIRRRN